MDNPLKKYQAWRSQREQRELERWAEVRADGKVRFVINSSLTLAFTMYGVFDVLDRIVGGAQHPISLRKIIFYLLIGVPAALIGWTNMEVKYKRALYEARLPALFSGDRPRNEDALRITLD